MLPKENRPNDIEPISQSESPAKVTKLLNKLAVIAIIVAAIGIGVFLKWSFQSQEVLKVNNEPFPVRIIKDESGKEQLVMLKVDFCKLQQAEGQLRTSYFNERQEMFLPISRERSEKGCVVTELPVAIPHGILPGEYRVKFRTVYKLNPVKQEVVNEFVSQSFKVE